MANEIYSKTWWGIGVCTNTINWGYVYKPYANCGGGLTPIQEAYKTRVEADGGIVESINCIII